MVLLETLFRDLASTEGILVCSFKPLKRLLARSVEEALTIAASMDSTEADAYFGVAPRSLDDMEKVTRVPAVWLDVDAKDFQEDLEGLCKTAIPPSFEVLSGHGLHLYWMLRPAVDSERAAELMKALWKAYGEGAGGRTYNAKWVLRVPGTTNYKDPAAPVPVVLRTTRTISYKPADVLALSRVPKKEAEKLWIVGPQSKKSRSEKDFDIVRGLLEAEVSDEAIHALYSILPCGDRYRESDGVAYMDRTIESVRARVTKPSAAGFAEREDSLWLRTSRGTLQVATFVFKPHKLIKVEEENGEDRIIGDVTSHGYTWENVMFPRSAFNSAFALAKHLRVASWQWLAGDREVRLWLPYLMDQLYTADLPHMRGTSVVGRHRNLWVGPEGAFGVDAVYDGHNAPYILLPTGRETPGLRYTFPPEDTYRVLVQTVTTLLPQINTVEVIAPIVGWFFATPVKPVLKEAGERFPVLNVYGTQGSGKSSTILYVFHKLMGHRDPRAHPSITRMFVLLSLMSSTNAVPISFGEFRDTTTRSHEEFLDVVRRAYDVGQDSRGRPDQTTQSYQLSAPFSVDGEDAFSDAAIRERSVIVGMSLDPCREGTQSYKAFQELARLPLLDFAGRYLQRTLQETLETVSQRFNSALTDLLTLLPAPMPDRVRRNLAVVQVGLQLYNEHAATYGGTLLKVSRGAWERVLEGTMLSLASGRTKIMADDFIEDVITYASQIPASPAFIMYYNVAQNVLWFHLTGALGWWAAKRRREGRIVLQVQAMRAQLKELRKSYTLPETYIGTGPRTQRCVGIQVGEAEAAGLDVPKQLRPFVEVSVEVQEGGEADEFR